MSGLLVAVAVVGYLVVGVVAARALVWTFGVFKVRRDGYDDDAGLVVGAAIFWLPVLPFVLFGVSLYGLYRLIALPPLRVRRERRHARLTAEVSRLERELGIGADR